MISRRTFIKTGLLGGALLATVAALHKPLDRIGKRALVDAHPLDPSLRRVIAAIGPVILAQAFPVEPRARAAAIVTIVDAVGIAVAALSAAAQKEVAELFALLDFAPTRIAVAGVSAPWEEASAEEIEGFLDKWRRSPIGLLKSGYMALHDLVLGAWYASPATWEGIGYPGPPAVLRSL